MNIFVPKVIGHRKDTQADFYVNFYMGTEDSKVEYRIVETNAPWKTMRRENAVDPTYLELYRHWDRMDTLVAGRRPSDAAVSSHLWRGTITTELPVGAYTLQVRATDMFGRVFTNEKKIKVDAPKVYPEVKK